MKYYPVIYKILISCLLLVYSDCAKAQNYTLQNAAEQWQKAIDLKNADLITTFFDTSIAAVYHSNPVVYGKEKNFKVWKSQFNDSLDQHPISIEKVDVSASEDMGYIYGKWWSIHPIENYYNGGRYLAVWKLKNKVWLIVMLSVNVQDDVKAEKKLK